MKIALSAYQCGPGMGSVSQIGWEWVRRMGHKAEVTVVTHVRNRQAIESRKDQLAAGLVIHYIDSEWFSGPLYRLAKWLFPRSEHGVFLIASLDFFLFDWLALRLLRSLQKKNQQHWDLLQIVTPVTLAAPSRLHRLGIPVVRGPLNCGLKSPKGFGQMLRHEREWVNNLRDWPRLLDWLWGSSKNTHLFLAATRATENSLGSQYADKTIRFLENGIDANQFNASQMPEPANLQNPLKVLFVGRLIALKGVDVLVQAVKKMKEQGRSVELQIVGDGPEKAPLEQLVQELQLSDCIEFSGLQPALEVASSMKQCHVFCLPSVRESGGAVILEAMASGRPVVTVNHGGPAELVDSQVGDCLDLTTPAELIEQLAASLCDVIDQPEKWQMRGEAAAARAHAVHDWDKKIDQALLIFKAGLQKSSLQLRHKPLEQI